jgi:hypothetical protein
VSLAAKPWPAGRVRWRRLGFGLATVLGLSRRGFFIPHRYADRLPGPGARLPYADIETLFQTKHAAFQLVLDWLGELMPALEALGGPPPAPRWDQDWFPRLDAAAAYALVRRLRPPRIVEVGSGHSTRFLARAIADEGYDGRITAIDPAPRADLDGLPVELLRGSLPEAGNGPFRDLASGDFLVIDSSHILMPGSDVDFLFGRVLPGLPAGAVVHVHDVFLPDDYPAEWDWRGYNEQLGVLPMLLGGPWDPLFASHYAAGRMAAEVAACGAGRLPLGADARESSLWLVKRGAS